MDFTIALTHFCEIHGPKSILCTQVLPLDCVVCSAPSPRLRSHASDESLTLEEESEDETESPSRLRRADTNLTLPTDFSVASTTIDSDESSPVIEKHPLFQTGGLKDTKHQKQFPYGRAQGETCSSCTFTVPQRVADKLPSGAPGSLKPDGKGKNGAPVLRSREMVCVESLSRRRFIDSYALQSSSLGSSADSYLSHHQDGDCHDHTMTYITAKTPDEPETYALLRASVIRTLSCERLPHGVSDGPFCFGDSNSGYTIAYVFRLTDPKARGRRRAYALVALAGSDPRRAFRACPLLWDAFATMAKGIEQAARRHQDAEAEKEEAERVKEGGNTRQFTPVSSFLTQRSVDPDGLPRRIGQTTPRSLADIVGDENIFAYLHQYFIAILRTLGDKLGGLPLSGPPTLHFRGTSSRTMSSESRPRPNSKDFQNLKIRDSDSQHGSPRRRDKRSRDEKIDFAKRRIASNIQNNKQCAPFTAKETIQRQVVV